MQLDFPANKQGVRYAYYVCSGRASKRNTCTRRAVPVGVAEQLVADCYQGISITEARYSSLASKVEAAFDERLAARGAELAELAANRRRLQDESDKILAAHFADAIDLDTLKRHQDRIRIGLADIDRRISDEHDQHEGPRKQIPAALRLLVDCAHLYARSDEQGKRLANQTFTDGIDISEDERASIRLAKPFSIAAGDSHSDGSCDSGLRPPRRMTEEPNSNHVGSSSKSSIVEPGGLEPPTPCLQSRCATNCAMAPKLLFSFTAGTTLTKPVKPRSVPAPETRSEPVQLRSSIGCQTISLSTRS